ncbi:MAG: S8 family serine peptidase, partial [bacterium]
MSSTRAGGAFRLLPLLLLAHATIASPAVAALRTRALPSLAGGIERSLAERAEALPAGRIHAIVEAAPGVRRELGSGVRLLRSIDGSLWLASLPAALVTERRLPPEVRRAWDLRPDDRLDPRLGPLLEAGDPLDVRVKVFEDEPVDAVVAEIRAKEGEILRIAVRLGVVDARVPATAVRPLAARDDVRWIERAPRGGVPANNNMRFSAHVNPVQALGIDGLGVRLGMWDSGIADTTHPDLAGRVTAGESGLFTVNHSSHVAGIAIGDGTNSQNEGGTPLRWRGVATSAEIVAYGIEDAIAEIDSAIQTWDIDLSTNSWVMPVDAGNCDDYGDYAFDAPEFDEIVTGIYGKRIPVVFAAGNERDDMDCGIPQSNGFANLPPPATAKNVISVAAHQSDGGGMTPFSSWGPTDDGRMKPDLAAPGCQASDDFGITSTGIGGAYLSLCGTSMAAPVVSGSIASLLQEWRARFPAEPNPSTLKVLLGGFASDRGSAGPDYKFGLGAVDLLASVVGLQTSTTIEDAVGHGGLAEWTFEVPSGLDTLTITLAW